MNLSRGISRCLSSQDHIIFLVDVAIFFVFGTGILVYLILAFGLCSRFEVPFVCDYVAAITIVISTCLFTWLTRRARPHPDVGNYIRGGVRSRFRQFMVYAGMFGVFSFFVFGLITAFMKSGLAAIFMCLLAFTLLWLSNFLNRRSVRIPDRFK